MPASARICRFLEDQGGVVYMSGGDNLFGRCTEEGVLAMAEYVEQENKKQQICYSLLRQGIIFPDFPYPFIIFHQLFSTANDTTLNIMQQVHDGAWTRTASSNDEDWTIMFSIS